MQTPITTSVQSYIKSGSAYKAYRGSETRLHVEGLEGYPLAIFLKQITKIGNQRLWVVVPTEEVARTLLLDLGLALDPKSGDLIKRTAQDMKIHYLPSTGRTLYAEKEIDNVEYEQANRLSEILSLKHGMIITTLRTFVSPLITPASLKRSELELKRGGVFDPVLIARQLAEGSYLQVPFTSAMGQFSVRGEVLDIFPFEGARPYRIYADWDKIGRISAFDPITQETIETVGSVSINILHEGGTIEYASIKEYLQKRDALAFIGDERLLTSYKSLQSEAKSLYRTAFQIDRNVPKPNDLLLDYPLFVEENPAVIICDITRRSGGNHRFDFDGPRSYFGNFTLLKDDLKALLRGGWKPTIFASNTLQRQRLEQMLSSIEGLAFEERELSGGFGIPSLQVLAICEHEIFGRRREVVKTLRHTQTSPLDSFVDLNEGDYVVHVNYGIGRFEKIDRVSSFDRERDFIKIVYADRENLYVPIEQANLIQRYIGSDGSPPRLDRLAGMGWETKKAKARKNAEDLAKHLITLYAKRMNSVGYAFSKDTDWQLQFEASFAFDETADQLQCIEEIKEDMEKPIVMDRLVCGDVGYGKTEIAFRAAFKAVMDGKQVAFLAPTTILAEQHYRTFMKRVGEFPVRSALLSRIVPPKRQKQILVEVAEGKVDVLFGTHRILQKDLLYHNLGLLIIDEEQRFGVKDKERIKTLRTNIDSLTLSATPIPRTLYMSLLKIRDMSLLATPPIERRAVETFIDGYDEYLVAKAIRRELERDGQVFYLHNRVESLPRVADRLRELVPEAIIDVAHGQMEAAALEDQMRRFIHQGIQVLVSTTIIENGIDIPNVNTIIIDRADRYGLAQLYQLRGRVGRSDRQGYAYLFYPPDSSLNELAVKRLRIISELTELGSGFKIALKDMEMRGTGNLLGRQQSGQVASVGLDMYIRILDEAIRTLQNEGEKEEDRQVLLELDYTGFIPDSYIKTPSVKFEVYRKISSIQNDEQLDALRTELADRYGQVPEEVENLLYIARIKILCRKLSITTLSDRRGVVRIEFGKVADLNIDKVMNLIALSNKKVRLDRNVLNIMYIEVETVSLKDKALFLLEHLERLL